MISSSRLHRIKTDGSMRADIESAVALMDDLYEEVGETNRISDFRWFRIRTDDDFRADYASVSSTIDELVEILEHRRTFRELVGNAW